MEDELTFIHKNIQEYAKIKSQEDTKQSQYQLSKLLFLSWINV